MASQQQNTTVTTERHTQFYTFSNLGMSSNQQNSSSAQVNVQVDSQVLSFLDSIIAFIKSTFLSSKSNFALFVLFVIYLFSNWSFTLQNKKGYSIDIVDILFIILVVYVIRAWLTGEGFGSIFDLITCKTQQVINLTQQCMSGQEQTGNRSNTFQNAFASPSMGNVRKLETVEQLYERYMKEKFQLSEQNFLDCENVPKLSVDAEQKLSFLVTEFQRQFEKELPFNINDVSVNDLPSSVNTEEDFKKRLLTPYLQRIREYVRFRFSIECNKQIDENALTQKKDGDQNNTPQGLYQDLLKIERELLMNRSQPIIAYSQKKATQFNNRVNDFVEDNYQTKLEEFKQKNGDDLETFDVVLGNNDRKEVELKKFVHDPVGHSADNTLEALLIADKIAERLKELEEATKAFKQEAKKNTNDNASRHKSTLQALVDSEDQNQDSDISKAYPENAAKQLESLLQHKIDQLVKDSSYKNFDLPIFEKYFDNAQEQAMKCESKSNMGASGKNSISHLLSRELGLVTDQPGNKVQPSLDKYVDLLTKFEYFVDQYKDDQGYLDKIRTSYDSYVDSTLNQKNLDKQQRRLRLQLNKVKDQLISDYLVKRYKKNLSENDNQYDKYQSQLAQLQIENDGKERKVNLLEEQVNNVKSQLDEAREKLGTLEISAEEEKQNLLKDLEKQKKKTQELFDQINKVPEVKEEKKEAKVERSGSVQIDAPEEMALRKTTSYQASITILEKSVRGITEVFYDNFRNTAYFNQADMIEQLKTKFGASVLSGQPLTQDQQDFIVKQFEDKFMNAEDEFLSSNLGGEGDNDSVKNQQNKKSIMNSLDKNFDILKTRLNKARDISDIQQVKITNAQDERDASKIVDDIVNGALTDTDETYNRQLIALKKIMLKYKAPAGTVATKPDPKSKSQPANPNQRVKQKIESVISYIQENMSNIKSQMKTYLSEDMRRTLKTKIVEWKRSQEDKKEVMAKWSLQSQNMWFTLIWHDSNDLDLVVKCPCGQKIYYGTKKCEQCGTYLEIDMNAGGNKNDKFPVEHIYLMKPPKVGSNWEVYAKMFHCNNNKDSPFTIQIEHEDGRIVSYQGTLDINENPQSPIYKYIVDKGIDEKEKNLILQIRTVIDNQEEFTFF